MFIEQKYLPNCLAFWESLRVWFLPWEQNGVSVTQKKKKGFSLAGVAYAVFSSSSAARLRQKQQIQLSSIFVLKTSKIHLKPVSFLGREM